MESKKQRRLVAIMFTDIVGYSKIMQTDEQRGITIRKRHRKVFEESTSKYEGELLQYYGDGTLSIFPSAAAATECAVELQKKFHENPRVPLRIGIHTGDITFAVDDAYGHGMNIAARIEPMCIPGGIYISGKVYEDIHNHNWLQAKSLGYFELKNINDAIEVFAITNKGVNAPEFEIIDTPDEEYIPPISPQEQVYEPRDDVLTGNKLRKRAGVLALLLGVFGVHRYYLGQRKKGMAHFIPAIFGIISGVWFLITIPAIIGAVDAIIFFSMSNKDFDKKYNTEKDRGQKKDIEPEPVKVERKPRRRKEAVFASDLSPQDKARKAYKTGDFDNAITLYTEMLEENPADAEIHFVLASCFSMVQDTKKGFLHLSKAVEYGYKDFKKIKNHITLAFLRSRNDFPHFEKNGFRLVKMLPSPQENLLDTERPQLLKKLDKIEELGELLHRGEISEAEFTSHKRNLLNE